MRRPVRCLYALLFTSTCLFLSISQTNDAKAELRQKLKWLPVPFVVNQGQADESVSYYARTFGGSVFVTQKGEIVYSLPKREGEGKATGGWVLKEAFVGGTIGKITAEEPAPTQVNALIGNDPSAWRNGIATCGVVSLGEVYPGIELKLKAHANSVEKLFHVGPGSDPDRIRLRLSGATDLKVNEAGELEAGTEFGPVTFTKPVAYQEIDGKRVDIPVRYALLDPGQDAGSCDYGFIPGPYDRSKGLVIDPLLQSTYLGGSGNDYPYGMVLDAEGNVYVAGWTESTDFSATAGAQKPSHDGSDTDVFVAKLNPALTSILSATYLGGSANEECYAVALDAGGNVYITGFTGSADFPGAAGGYQPSSGGGTSDIFVAKLNPSLTSVQSTYYGGSGSFDYPYALAVDAAGSVYIAGDTFSNDLPGTAGGARPFNSTGHLDAFVAKFNPSLTSLSQATYLGGNADDYPRAIAFDSGGNVYIAGYTASTDFPGTTGGAQPSHAADGGTAYDAFVAKLNPSLTSLIQATYLGGNGWDNAYAITLDSDGNVYVAGNTPSTDFPGTAGGYQPTYGGGTDASDGFVAKLAPSLTSILNATYLGGNANESASAIALDSDGNVYITGGTNSTNFPVLGGVQLYAPGNPDGFVAKLDSSLTSLLYATCLGGSGPDIAQYLALDPSRNVYVAGVTGSSNLRGAAGGAQPLKKGGIEAFVARLELIPDDTNPVPVIDYPRDQTALLSLDEVSGTVSDPQPSWGISKIEVAIRKDTQLGSRYLQADKQTWNTTEVYHLASLNLGIPQTWSLSVGNVWTSEQSYTITARATDNAGRTGNAASTFTYYVQSSAFTTLTMDLSSQAILSRGQLSVAGKLSRLPEVNLDLRNLSVSLDIRTPSGATVPVDPAATGVDGSYGFIFPGNNAAFTEEGIYTLQAKFAKWGSLEASASDVKSVLVGASAGYAILVQGKLPGSNPEGLASHNKTTNRVYGILKARGFDDANILYFNDTIPQTGIGIDGLPTKAAVESAIRGWAKERMNAVPAPLYLILVDHGVPNAFHIGDNTLSPAELSSWLDGLEAGLDPEARQERIVTIIGACYSGSFIPLLSKPGSRRIIITSAGADEESYKGPLEGGDAVRSGEYFIDALFLQLGRGYSLKGSFEEATRQTEEYTRKGGTSANSPNAYFDTAMQHPLIDDNQDERGSNLLAEGRGDGQAAGELFLGTGPTYSTNAGVLEITELTQTNYLAVSASTASLWLKANNPTKVSSAWAIIRPPGLDLSQNPTTGGYQRDIELTPRPMSWNGSAGRYELTHTGFADPGQYEIFYYVIETGAPAAVSPLVRSAVYKDKAGNTAPSAPALVKPAPNEVTRTALVFQWNASTDADPVTYNLVIATDSAFSNVVFRREGIGTTIASVDAGAGLKDLTTYYWRVEAVDGYTRIWTAWRIFRTDNTNGLPGILTGIVFSDRDYALISAATIQAMVDNNPVLVDMAADGSFILSSLSGTATFSVSAPGYQPLTVSDVAVVAGDTVPVNLRMVPEHNRGDLNGDSDLTLADAILALRALSRIRPLGTVYLDAAQTGGTIGMTDAIYILQRIAGTRAQ